MKKLASLLLSGALALGLLARHPRYRRHPRRKH